MLKKFRALYFLLPLLVLTILFVATNAFAARPEASAAVPDAADKGTTLWQLVAAGGTCMIFLGLLSVAALALIIYHLKYVHPEKLVPKDFTENLLFLLEKKEYQKAISVCKQQENLISAIALKGLAKISHGKAVIEGAIQYEGKARMEKLWQNLNYLGDMAVIAPMLGLLGTILGMISAFNYFKLGTIHPTVLTQGLAKAMVNTAFGLVITVPCLAFYSYFRGKISKITSTAEAVASEMVQLMGK